MIVFINNVYDAGRQKINNSVKEGLVNNNERTVTKH